MNLKRGNVCTSADEHEGGADCLPGWKCEAARMGAGERCEMRNVVNACIDAGIRDDIIIMVGSAGDTCDDIGADISTEKAGEAARRALEALSARNIFNLRLEDSFMKKVQSIVLCLLLSVAMILPSGSWVFAADGIPAGGVGADGDKTVLTEYEDFLDEDGDEWDDGDYDDEDWDGDWDEDEDEDVDPDAVVDPNPSRRLSVSKVTYKSGFLSWQQCEVAEGYNVCFVDYDKDFNEIYRIIGTVEGKENTTYTVNAFNPMHSYELAVIPYAHNAKGELVDVKNSIKSEYVDTPMCYDGKFYSSNAKAAKSMTKVLKTYKYGAKFKGRGECYGYAEWASTKIAKKRKMVKVNKKITPANVKKYVCNLKAGSHVRLNGNYHSLVILKAMNDVIYWADNNNGYSNRVHYFAGDAKTFCNIYHGHKNIEWINKTVTFR